MIIYNVVIEDRHCDVTVKSFKTKQEAVDYAKKTALEYCMMEKIEEKSYSENDKDGWIYKASYSCEGDYVRVVKTELK